ncbi:MAG TPA: hypothetical protein VM529_09300, partial [Gemmata sp.]|nr:hypothetical protein [Gemmata sp.]
VANDEFDPNPENDLNDLSLREAIFLANQDSDATQTINLASGVTYSLTIANTAGQENATAEGDLDIVDQGGVAGAKTYLIAGLGSGAIIDQAVADRVFHILGASATDLSVTFQNVTIRGGEARDDGTAGASDSSTDALGGGVLSEGGGDVAFLDSFVQGNSAIAAGGSGGGSAAEPGVDGFSAFGGGVYSAGGTVTLTNTQVTGNNAVGDRLVDDRPTPETRDQVRLGPGDAALIDDVEVALGGRVLLPRCVGDGERVGDPAREVDRLRRVGVLVGEEDGLAQAQVVEVVLGVRVELVVRYRHVPNRRHHAVAQLLDPEQRAAAPARAAEDLLEELGEGDGPTFHWWLSCR